MELTAYLLSRVVWATTPAGETATEAQARAEAIAAMLRAFAPDDGVEAMMACQCITMQFVLDSAMRDASNPHQEPAAHGKVRAGAISASRTLHQWVTKLENYRKRNERRTAEAAKAQAAAQPEADPSSQPARNEPLRQPDPSPAGRSPANRPAPNGQVAAERLDPLFAAAVAARSAASRPGLPGSAPPNPQPLSLSAEVSKAA